MTKMVERVARSLARSTFLRLYPTADTEVLRIQEDIMWRSFVADASNAIFAMREPTEAMCEAGATLLTDDRGNPGFSGEATGIFEAMIDAALGDPR
jgi:hypothetical protein